MSAERKEESPFRWVALPLSAASLAWTAWNLMDLLKVGAIGITVAGFADVIWGLVIWAEYRGTYVSRKWVVPALGWALLLVVTGFLVWHGVHIHKPAVAVVGPFLTVGAKIAWVLTLADMTDPAALTPEQIAQNAEEENQATMDRLKRERDEANAHSEHKARMDKAAREWAEAEASEAAAREAAERKKDADNAAVLRDLAREASRQMDADRHHAKILAQRESIRRELAYSTPLDQLTAAHQGIEASPKSDAAVPVIAKRNVAERPAISAKNDEGFGFNLATETPRTSVTPTAAQSVSKTEVSQVKATETPRVNTSVTTAPGVLNAPKVSSVTETAARTESAVSVLASQDASVWQSVSLREAVAKADVLVPGLKGPELSRALAGVGINASPDVIRATRSVLKRLEAKSS